MSALVEVGKFTTLAWNPTGVLEVANDSSAGELGFCDTRYGMYNFRAQQAGDGSIEARIGDLVGKLPVIAAP